MKLLIGGVLSVNFRSLFHLFKPFFVFVNTPIVGFILCFADGFCHVVAPYIGDSLYYHFMRDPVSAQLAGIGMGINGLGIGSDVADKCFNDLNEFIPNFLCRGGSRAGRRIPVSCAP